MLDGNRRLGLYAILFSFGAGFAITLSGLSVMSPDERKLIFMFALMSVLVIAILLTGSHISGTALRQDDADENRKFALWQRQGRGPQVVVQSPRQQAPNPYHFQSPIPQQIAQLPQAQQGMPIEQDVTIGGG